nr:uncharacterized protein LOC109149952 [Ipomoea batatas]
MGWGEQWERMRNEGEDLRCGVFAFLSTWGCVNIDLLSAFVDSKNQALCAIRLRNMKPKRMQMVWRPGCLRCTIWRPTPAIIAANGTVGYKEAGWRKTTQPTQAYHAQHPNGRSK